MSEQQLFLQEREQIDFLINKGYQIKTVTESLDGDLVSFERIGTDKEVSGEVLLIQTTKARKYFSVKLIQQQTT